MRTIPHLLRYVAIFSIAVAIGFEISSLKAKRSFYRQDLETHIVNVDVSLDVLEKLRGKEYDKAILGLETAMLTETLGLADDEKVLGRNNDIQGIVKKMSEYCSKYNVFDGKTNLPSHHMAKQFLDSHNSVSPAK